MRLALRCGLFFTLFIAFFAISAPADQAPQGPSVAKIAQPQIVRVAATVDGSGRISFTRGKVVYEHKHWNRPTIVYFDGTPWNLDSTPASWLEYSNQLDLTKAWIVKRQGRDVIALEHTPDGFDLYLSDSPNGSADYEVAIAIPRGIN